MPEAYFQDSIRIQHKDSAVLMTVISIESTLQKGTHWNQFLALVEQAFNEKKLSKLIIVTTGYLQRHYFLLDGQSYETDKRAMEIDEQWLSAHYPNKTNIPIALITWKDLLQLSRKDAPSYEAFHSDLIADYRKNKAFQHIVDKHAEGYVTRKIVHHCKGKAHFDRNQFHQAAVNYVLEECAAIQQLFRCHADLLAYPHGKNPPANYVWNKYFKDEPLRYVRYKTKNWDLEDSSSRYGQSSLFKLKKEISPHHYLTGYVDGSLRDKSWNFLQQCLFIRGIKELVDSVNAKEPQVAFPIRTRKSI